MAAKRHAQIIKNLSFDTWKRIVDIFIGVTRVKHTHNFNKREDFRSF
jgi:hypothetical protein